MKYFSLKEMYRSATADRLHINNRPSEQIEMNLKEFIETILDPIREAWGRPIYVNSGYRCPRLNSVVGGARYSGHMYGWCADLRVKDRSIREFADFIKGWMKKNGYAWDEILYESSGGVQWVHFAWKGYRGRQRMKSFDIMK